MTRLDFTPYRRSTVGFDRLFDLLEGQTRQSGGDNYPPFNIERRGDDAYRITLALAGFRSEDLDITAQQNLLIIQGRKQAEDETSPHMLHVGIASRNFERRFELADYVHVADAKLADGLLAIDLLREVSDAMKPKKIAVNGGSALPVVRDAQKAESAA